MNRERQEKWDAAHLRVASTKLSAEQYLAIKGMCALQGTTVYALIKALLLRWVIEAAQQNPENAAEVLRFGERAPLP